MPITPPKTTPTDRRVLGVALSIGIAGVLMTAVPAIDFRIKQTFAERLGRHAETAAPAAARLETRQLAERGLLAIPALVRLAGSANPDAADAARDAVSAALASWESEYRTTHNAPRLAEKLTVLARALEGWTPSYEIVARLWADRLALQVADDCEVLSGRDAATLLAHCDRILAVAPAQARLPAPIKATDSDGGLLTNASDASESTGRAGGFQAPVARDAAAQILPEPAPEFIASAPLADADLRLIEDPPVTPTAPAPKPLTTTAPSRSEPLEPRIAADSAPPRPLPPPAPKPEVVDVPPPQQIRLMLRKYRQMSDIDLARELATSNGFSARTVQQVLRERDLPTAVGPSATLSRGQDSDVERRILEQVSRLTPARGRQLLRDLVTDAGEDADVRLQALALLATSGDPMLAAIARERAVADADPRVAELATRIVREQDAAKK